MGQASRAVAGLTLFTVCLLTLAAPAGAQTTYTYDVSYPQCGTALPSNADAAIVGVNGGVALSANPCLADLVSWAHATTHKTPSFYINTGDPGPAHSSHWPVGQLVPRVCRAGAPNSTACSFDYGWNFARDAYTRALAAERTATGASTADAHAALNATGWWLDVETSNSWQTLENDYGQSAAFESNDVAALQGALTALAFRGAHTLGIYSTSYQWGLITGGSAITGSRFVAERAWLAGYTTGVGAANGCNATSFTGGTVSLTQYQLGNFDVDYECN